MMFLWAGKEDGQVSSPLRSSPVHIPAVASNACGTDKRKCATSRLVRGQGTPGADLVTGESASKSRFQSRSVAFSLPPRPPTSGGQKHSHYNSVPRGRRAPCAARFARHWPCAVAPSPPLQEGTATGDQWALGGDTWVAGCKIPDSCVYPNFNTLNPDMHDERYRTEQGVYRDMRGARHLASTLVRVFTSLLALTRARLGAASLGVNLALRSAPCARRAW